MLSSSRTPATRQVVTIPWTPVNSFEAVERFAETVRQNPRVWRNYSTAIGEALLFTMADFDEVADCSRKLIDLSGDGPSNEGAMMMDCLPERFVAWLTVLVPAVLMQCFIEH